MPERRIRVAVVFGGRSTEHSISCVSAGSVLAALDRDRYDVVAVGITPDGRWVLAGDDPARLAIHGRELPSVDPTGSAVALPGDPAVGGIVVLEPGRVPVPLSTVDVVFPLLHGPYGEDGTIQGLLELAGVPYVGSGVFASAAAMDKEYMKLLFGARGLPVAPHVVVGPAEWSRDPARVGARVRAALTLPVFVKPARGGSSIGITRVTDWDQLPAALIHARSCDPKVLVEEAVAGREIECGVLDGPDGGPPEASLPAEIRVAGRDFYDFEAKYIDADTQFDIPAKLSDDETRRVRELAVQAFQALGCEGLARVDFFRTPSGQFVVNELNTMPGFTPASMFPQMWLVTGIDYPALVDRLLQSALRRGTGLR
jgi:D-alanine-D-alanine ligase